jgi:mRNA interferase RelE/StbE
MSHSLRFEKHVAKRIQKLPPKEQERLKAVLRSLAKNPRGEGSKKLSEDIFRYRFGDYRVIYAVQDKKLVVLVLDVMQRKENHHNLDTLLKRYRVYLETQKDD